MNSPLSISLRRGIRYATPTKAATACMRLRRRSLSHRRVGSNVWIAALTLAVVIASPPGTSPAYALDSAAAVAPRSPDSASTSPVADSLDSTPWYDAKSKQVVPIGLQPRVDDSIHRDSRWLPKPKRLARSAASTTTATKNNNSGVFGSSLTWGSLFGWVLLAAIVTGIVGTIVYAVSRAELRMPGRGESTETELNAAGLPDEQTLERIKHLPPELRRTDVNLRTECERLMREGRFDQAIILLLGHQLLLLDRNGLLRLSRGKTNGRYVRETQSSDQASAHWLRATADAFEQSYFGRHEISSDIFAELWHQNELMESKAHSFGAAK